MSIASELDAVAKLRPVTPEELIELRREEFERCKGRVCKHLRGSIHPDLILAIRRLEFIP